MSKKAIESRSIHSWDYERIEFQSSILGRVCHYGALRPSKNAPIQTTLYLLHGGGADDTQILQAGLGPLLIDALPKAIAGHLQIVFPFVGNSFLHEHPTSRDKSYSQYFIQEVLPNCENTTKTTANSRFIGGLSMGGQAALNMFFRKSEMFSGVGVHFPTLVAFDYNSKSQQDDFAKRCHVSAEMMSILISEFQKEFLDLQDFNKHDPLQLAKAATPASLKNKKIYFDVGENDEFGLVEGGKALHHILEQKQISHHFEVVPAGKHDGPFLYARLAKMIQYLL